MSLTHPASEPAYEAASQLQVPSRAAGRINNFDFLRFALATLVILSHSWDLLNGRESNPVLLASRGQTELGSVAVDGFFVLSGFLITMSFVNSRSVLDYLRRRVFRIYPGYLMAAVVSLVFFAPLAMLFSRDYWHWVEPGTFLIRLPFLRTFWISDTFIHNHWPYVNSPIWTIQHEFVCYLLIAVLGTVGILRHRGLLVALFVPIYVFNLIQLPWKLYIYNWQELPVGGAPDYYPRFWTYYLAGALAFLYRDRIRFNLLGVVVSVAAILVTAAMGRGLDAVMPFAFTYILLSLAFFQRIRLQHWAKYGDVSYGLYLYGWPVQQSLIFLCKSWINPALLFAMALPSGLVFAVASWYLVERHFLRFKSRPMRVSGSPK